MIINQIPNYNKLKIKKNKITKICRDFIPFDRNFIKSHVDIINAHIVYINIS